MHDVKELSRVFKALSDETRLRLLKLLLEQGPEGALCVTALALNLGVSQSAISQHLAVLRATDLVVDERRGYFVHYGVNWARLRQVREQMRAVLGEEFAEALAG